LQNGPDATQKDTLELGPFNSNTLDPHDPNKPSPNNPGLDSESDPDAPYGRVKGGLLRLGIDIPIGSDVEADLDGEESIAMMTIPDIFYIWELDCKNEGHEDVSSLLEGLKGTPSRTSPLFSPLLFPKSRDSLPY
jgi:hypothetical protein